MILKNATGRPVVTFQCNGVGADSGGGAGHSAVGALEVLVTARVVWVRQRARVVLRAWNGEPWSLSGTML